MEARHPERKSDFSPSPTKRTRNTFSWNFKVLFVAVVSAAVLYRLEPFEPVRYPASELSRHTLKAPSRNAHMGRGSEMVGKGHLVGPEDLAYNAESGVIYTGCSDGWIKRVTVNESVADSAVHEWVNTGGRPLGVALGPVNGEVIVADSDKGLLRVTQEGKVELLTDEAEGLKFKITDGVDIANDGIIYFTDASHKYPLKDFALDMLEGNPNGRLLSYNPATKQTTLLAKDLYFPNGVAVSPDQTCVIFCETLLRRCRKYYTQGPKKGSIDKFIEDLPGVPDNIHYDGKGHYWIALSSSLSLPIELALKHPFLRKVFGMIVKYVRLPHMEKNGGVIAVDLEGKPIAHYYDSGFSWISSGIKIGNHIYCGSLLNHYIIRLDLRHHPALATT